jgi:signal transduction histidine kinase
MKIDQANEALNPSDEDARTRLQELHTDCSEIAVGIQSLSHELHSAVLDYLGVAIAIGQLCEDFAKQYAVNVAFAEDNVPELLPKDTSLCLFRIAQEALHNAIKYSGARDFTVELSGSDDTVELVVSDEGAGFDVQKARSKGGLGLVSMHERANLVYGKFSVESAPGKGTRILVAVPLTLAGRRYSEDYSALETTRGRL